jgi:hypothetical protein
LECGRSKPHQKSYPSQGQQAAERKSANAHGFFSWLPPNTNSMAIAPAYKASLG